MSLTQGVLTSMQFDTKTADFKAEFTFSDLAQANSSAYLNQKYWYGGEPEVVITVEDQQADLSAIGYACSDNQCSFDIRKHAGIMSGDKVTVTARAY